MREQIRKAIDSMVVELGSSFSSIAYLLSKYWRKRVLAKVATIRMSRGEVLIPYVLLNSLKNKRLVDKRKANNLCFKSRVLKGLKEPSIKLSGLYENHNKTILLVVHNSLPYDSAGYAHRTMREAKAYRDLGYDVTIVTRQGYPWDLAKHRNLPYEASQIVDGFSVYTLTGNRQYKVDSDLKYAVEYGNKIADLALRLGVGYIQASSNYINGLASYIASRKSAIPFVYEARGMWHVTRASNEKGYGQTESFRYEDAIERWIINHSSASIFITDELRKKYVNNAATATSILPNCIDASEGSASGIQTYSEGSKFRLLYAGSIVFYEGLETLVEIVAGLEKQDIELSIYGNGPNVENLVKAISKYNAKNITYFGRVEQAIIKRAYGTHHAVVVPRIHSDVTMLVPPLKPLEAIWNGLPVIVSDLPSIREIMGEVESVLYVKPSDSRSLKDKILKLKHEHSKYLASVDSDRAYIRSERNWTSQMSRVINDLCQTAPE